MAGIDIEASLAPTRIVPVVELDDAELAHPLGEALAAGGLACAEVTFRTPAAIEALGILARRDDLLVGAGTIVSVEQLDAAVDAGARFLVSPGFAEQLVVRARERSVPILPGIATATELLAAVRLGLRVAKFFPAEAMGGVATLKALSAPFGGVRFVPTGGIGPGNLGDYLALPSVLAVGGSWMVTPELMRAGAWQEIQRLAGECVSLTNALRPPDAAG